jgi:sialidase-1
VLPFVLAIACGRLGFSGEPPTGTGGGGGGSVTPDAPAPVPTVVGLVAYWPFDTASQWPDTAGGNMATCNAGACPATIPGVIGNAADFNGTTSCLSVASLAGWNDRMFTISAWVRSSAMSGPIVVHEEAPPGCPGPELVAKNGVGVVQNSTTGMHNQAWTLAALASPNTWHHVAVEWNGTSQIVFVDGACQCATTPVNQPVWNVPQPFSIGCYPTDSPAGHFTGAIDEVRVYNRALANDEVAVLYEAGGGTITGSLACPQIACGGSAP